MLSVLLQYLEGLKTEIQLSKSEDQIGFLQQFMNRAPAHLANRKELWRAIEKERFLKAERGWGKEVY